MSYCTYCKTLPEDNHHRIYHDNHYGFPIESDNELFERLVFEINQAGLSWDLILKKQGTFRLAYHQFDIETVANYDEKEVARLLNDAGVIRNRLKVSAAIHNAKEILKLQAEHGTFKNWLEHQHPKTKEEWVKTFKKTFKFTGGEIVNEFLMSTGYLSGAHDTGCHILKKIKNGKN
jgi:DNA-3-methyladenine glycosylase I